MAWWQRKLLRYALRYALSQTGLLEDGALDLDKLDITVGKRNLIELRDVALNIDRIGKLAHLPPELRIETARVLSLRLIIPADFYQTSIVAQIDGVLLVVRLEEANHVSPPHRNARSVSPTTVRTPQHRKTRQRIPSPPPFDPAALKDPDENIQLPTAQEVARSFLMQEPLHERQELEASITGKAESIEESFVSETSNADENTGTGMSIGVPGFLSSFLQGITDRFKLDIQNVQVKLEAQIHGASRTATPVTLRFSVGGAQLDALGGMRPDDSANETPQRTVKLRDISVDLLSSSSTLGELSGALLSQASEASKSSDQGLQVDPMADAGAGFGRRHSSSASSNQSFKSIGTAAASPLVELATSKSTLPLHQSSHPGLVSSLTAMHADETTDLGQDPDDHHQETSSDFDIQLGDDNISWGSRKGQAGGGLGDDLWRSMASESDLPDSLLLEPAHSSRRHSQVASSTKTRQRRPVSPYDRAFQSPGSWPRLNDSPEHQGGKEVSGSWPAPQNARQTVHEGIVPLNPVAEGSDITDNKRYALDAASSEMQHGPAHAESSSTLSGDMLESKVFSHDDAKSMYMSAMAGSSTSASPENFASDSIRDRPSSPVAARGAVVDDRATTGDMSQASSSHTYSYRKSGNATPRPQTPTPNPAPAVDTMPAADFVCEILHVDSISLSLPDTSGAVLDPTTDVARSAQFSFPTTDPTLDPSAKGVPGSFSTYSEMSSSRWQKPEDAYQGTDGVAQLRPSNSRLSGPGRIGIAVGTVRCQFDIPVLRVLHALLARGHGHPEAVKGANTSNLRDVPAESQRAEERALSVVVQQVVVSLKHKLAPHAVLGGIALSAHEILTLDCRQMEFEVSRESDIRFGHVAIALGGQNLVTLAREPAEEGPVLKVLMKQSATTTRTSVTSVSVESVALHVHFDAMLIDEVCGTFGGISGFLELGTSVLSESGLGSPASRKPRKGVRFEDADKTSIPNSEIKINACIAGIKATLRASSCSMSVRSSTLKAVYRQHGFSATCEHISITGPQLNDMLVSTPIAADLSTLRVDFLNTPNDKDLERLLSLLTPSKDRYDGDDDILIDTLLRQRRKGSLLRVVVGGVRIKVDTWDCISLVRSLGDDLARLSEVTKYLPEDERPGLLTLVRIRVLDAQFPVNERFEKLKVKLQDLHLAQVSLPALLAFSISTIGAEQLDGPTLLHAMVPDGGQENSPAFMARMLGDEEEPTIKIKLFNVCVEYSVPTFFALMGINKELEPEEAMNAMAQSIANLGLADDTASLKHSLGSETPKNTAKRYRIDLLIHDSAIGLQPDGLTSKAYLVLTDTHITTNTPPQGVMLANLNLRKASLFLTDRFSDSAAALPRVSRVPAESNLSTQLLGNYLMDQGFVSVGSVMSATVQFSASNGNSEQNKAVEVDVHNELLLLETCADSTQTLFAVMGALFPPTPPSVIPKYLNNPEPIEDLIRSMSGDAMPVADRGAEVLYDVEEQTGSEVIDMDLETSLLDGEPDDLLAESDMLGSLYGPVSGILDMPKDEDEVETSAANYPETAESLLEEDPFEMTNALDDRLSDAALLRDLGRQSKPSVNDEPIELELYEIEDLGYDALGTGQQALGPPHRITAPTVHGRIEHSRERSQQDVPLRLHIRDFHMIWHLHDGYDWQNTRDGIANAVEEVEKKVEERRAQRRHTSNDADEDESVIGDFLFNSIYIGVPAGHEAQELRRQINRNIDEDVSETVSIPVSGLSKPTTASGQPQRQRRKRRLKLGRSKSHKIAFELKGVSADMVVLPPGSGETVSSVDIRLRDFEIFDKVPTSTWRKFMTHMNSDTSAREMSKPMFHIQLDTVKTLASHSASEMTLHVEALPLRLHVDQDALDFITRFFEFKDQSVAASGTPADKPFIQRIEVEEVHLCLDYKPKSIDYAGLRSGKTAEFMNIITLEGANIRLRHAIAYGLRGFDELHPTLNGIWMPDITRNQLPTVLAGLAPVRGLVNLGAGVRDVVAIPIREYKKDGRIVRSIQKGAFQFGKTTTSELARLGAKVALGTQTLLSNAEELLSPAESSKRNSFGRAVSSRQGWHDAASDDEEPEQRAVSAYANQPLGLFPGLRSARRHLEHDLLTARDALIAVQGEFLESRGPGEAAGAIVKHAPTVILRPVIGATRAVGSTLLGVGNQIDQGHLRKVDDVSVLTSITHM